jgi:predicted RNA-binding protein with TRAM domain
MRNKMSKSRQGGRYEGRRGHGKGFQRCPVALGEELEVEISELSPKGEGIAKNQGYVIYVAQAKVGDRVKVKITRISEKAADAQTIK